MFWRSGASLLVLIQAILFLPHHAFASAAIQPQRPAPVTSSRKQLTEDSWTISHAQHAYGLPEVKPKQKGTLTLDSQNITFAGKAVYRIPRASVIAISDGSERVEMWGMKGRLLRMAIPNGGGLAAAGFMHHKESSLTVEFRDPRGGYHSAVFVVPPADATLAMATFAPRSVEAARRLSACRGLRRRRDPQLNGHHLDIESLALDARVVIQERLRDGDDGIGENRVKGARNGLYDETT